MVGLVPVLALFMNHIACSQYMKYLFSLSDVVDAAEFYSK